MNYRIIAHTLGWVLNIEAACMLLPMLCAVIYKEHCAAYFLMCILLCILVGIPLVVKQPRNKNMYSKEGFMLNIIQRKRLL